MPTDEIVKILKEITILLEEKLTPIMEYAMAVQDPDGRVFTISNIGPNQIALFMDAAQLYKLKHITTSSEDCALRKPSTSPLKVINGGLTNKRS